MSDRSSRTKKKDSDFAVTAFRVVQEATRETEERQAEPEQELSPEDRHAAAVALGRLGGNKGGPARAAKLTPGRAQGER